MIVQYVKIMLKILTPYLYDQVKPFLDNIEIKGPKTIYNNKKLVLGIRQYVVEHIQNLDKILIDLKQAGITIAKAKVQFCQDGIKIVGYIYDANNCHSNILKILKILN